MSASVLHCSSGICLPNGGSNALFWSPDNITRHGLALHWRRRRRWCKFHFLCLHHEWRRCMMRQRFRSFGAQWCSGFGIQWFLFAAIATFVLCIHLFNAMKLSNATHPNVFGWCAALFSTCTTWIVVNKRCICKSFKSFSDCGSFKNLIHESIYNQKLLNASEIHKEGSKLPWSLALLLCSAIRQQHLLLLLLHLHQRCLLDSDPHQ